MGCGVVSTGCDNRWDLGCGVVSTGCDSLGEIWGVVLDASEYAVDCRLIYSYEIHKDYRSQFI